MDIELSCDDLSVKNGYRKMTASLSGVDVDEMLSVIPIKDAIRYYGSREILDEIQIKEIIDHYDEEEIIEHLDLKPHFENIKIK